MNAVRLMVICGALLSGWGTAMAEDKDPLIEERKALKAQIDALAQLLSAQTLLLAAQTANTAASSTQDAATRAAILSALTVELGAQKGNVDAEAALAKAKVAAAFADVTALREATKAIGLPTGKEGNITIAVGTVGTELLSSKGAVFDAVQSAAKAMLADPELQRPSVLVTENQIVAALKADLIATTIQDRTQELSKATKAVLDFLDPSAKVAPQSLAAVMAGIYTGGLVLDTVNSLGKLLRTDKSVALFSQDSEAAQVLAGVLCAEPKIIQATGLVGDGALKAVGEARLRIDGFAEVLAGAIAALALFEKEKEEAAKPGTEKKTLPATALVDALRRQIAQGRALLASVDPATTPDGFWSFASGTALSSQIGDKQRVLLDVKAQALQTTEDAWYRSKKVTSKGEVQVFYKVLSNAGALVSARTILRATASQTVPVSGSEVVEKQWPN